MTEVTEAHNNANQHHDESDNSNHCCAWNENYFNHDKRNADQDQGNNSYPFHVNKGTVKQSKLILITEFADACLPFDDSAWQAGGISELVLKRCSQLHRLID